MFWQYNLLKRNIKHIQVKNKYEKIITQSKLHFKVKTKVKNINETAHCITDLHFHNSLHMYISLHSNPSSLLLQIFLS